MTGEGDIATVIVPVTVESMVTLPEPENEAAREELPVSELVAVATGETVTVKTADKDTELIGDVLDDADSETKDE